jgi:sugar lactone lactonase YvrE
MAAVLSACGSGNNNTLIIATPTPTVAATPTPTATATSSATPTPTATATATINVSVWVANGTNVLEFAPSQLLVLGASSPVPQLTNNSAAFGATQGVTFDTAGDLWVIDGGTVATGGKVPPGLDEFTPAQLAALKTTPNPTPNVKINSADFVFPQQAVFDATGNLWVSDNGANAVFEFTPAQLAAGGANVTPNITITSTPKFTGPLGIAFGATGNLWIANNGTTTIFEFNAASLPTTSGAVVLTPNVVLSDDGKGSIQAPWALIFDTAGNLWSSNANAPNTVVEFAKADLGATGSPTPAVTLSPTTVAGDPSLVSPNGIAFDNLGDLAAANSLAPLSISLFNKAQLGASGATVPSVFFSGAATTLNAPAGDVFGPVH